MKKQPKTPALNPIRTGIFLLSGIAGVMLYTVPADYFAAVPAGLMSFIRAGALMTGLFFLFERIFNFQLHTKILLGMLLGAIAGIVYGAEVSELKPIGTAFIKMIQMIVVPLVLASLIVGTASLGDISKMKRIGTKTLLYYLASTAVAITVGLVLANVVQPGAGISEEVQNKLLESYSSAAGEKMSVADSRPSTVDTFLDMIPSNPFAALGKPSMLQIIFFSIFVGVALTLIPKDKATPVIAFFDGLNDVMIKIVVLVIEIAPYGVFALIAEAVGSFGIEILSTLVAYTAVTIFGLAIMIGLYPVLVSMVTRRNPMQFLRAIRPAQLIAFSTSSSGATLPVSMEVAEDNVGVSKEITSFVLPLGATVNMDGTALYQGVATLFIAQVYGIPLDLGDQLIIVLTATLASIGTAAAPGVGILMLVIILQQVGIPLEGIALILAVDRLLDMCRTTVNVTSDITAATIIAHSEGQLRK